MDISFKNLSKSVLSPEADTQSIGRCTRWGEYDDPIIQFFRIEKEKSSENSAIETLYDVDLNNKWYDFLLSEIQDHNLKMTLDDFYLLYNKFNKKYENEIKAFIRSKYNKSLESLSNMEPLKCITRNTKKGAIINTQSLRTKDKSVFVIYRSADDREKFVGPFSVNIPKNIPRSMYFHEDGDIVKKQNKAIKNCIQKKQFDYPKFYKNKVIHPDVLYGNAFKNSTPYIAFDKEYSKEYGLAKLSIYNK